MRWAGLRACSGCKATGSFTSAAGSGDGSAGASSSGLLHTPYSDAPVLHLILVQIIPFGIFVCCVVEVSTIVLEEVAFGVLLPNLPQERRQLFVGHKQMFRRLGMAYSNKLCWATMALLRYL